MELREQIARAIAKRGGWEPYSWLGEAEDVIEAVRPIIEERDALRADIEAMKKQVPVCRAEDLKYAESLLHVLGLKPEDNLYALPGAQTEATHEGWQLVPVEPDGRMLSAAQVATGREGIIVSVWLRKRIYDAMLSAAPNPEIKE